MKRNLSFAIAFAMTLLVVASGNVASAASEEGSPLLQAARGRDTEAVRALLKRGVDANARQDDGATALHWAAHWNDLASAELLLDHGARVNQANEYGATPLWLAATNASAPMVKLLLDRGADPNVALHFGETPLMTASRAGALEVVRALLAKKAKVETQELQHGQTALMWATAENHLDVMQALLDAGANPNTTSKTGVTPLMFTARRGSIDAARLLLDRGADINAQSRVVNESALGGGVSKTQQGGATTLLRAVVRGHVEQALFLLERGANPNLSGTGYMPLHWAAGKWEASINKEYAFQDDEWSSLYGIRSQKDKERLIRALVAKGADINARTKIEPTRPGATLLVLIPNDVRVGQTPFYIAAQSADPETMRLLLSLGADPSISSANKTTPMMVAAGRLRIDYESTVREEDALEAVKVAHKAGNDIHAVNDLGETPLHVAAMAGWNSIVEYFVANGASLDAKDKKGKTPAMHAEEGNGYSNMLTQKRPETAALLIKLAEKAR
jgi:uncharacterized protein